jgi:hypothetical protein
MLSKNMIVNRVVTGAGNRVICIKEGKKKKVSEKIRFNKRIFSKCLSCDFVKLSVIVSGEMPLKVVSLIALLDILNLLTLILTYRDPTVKFFYFDRITRSKILKSANSLFKFIVINKKFEEYFGSRVEFYKAVEFIFFKFK